ncbi:hypothetical protein ABW20_dc0108826 [Dactylellina cionopaga]|nr:hypothetical protein ABW20_dc0108826 [Dactylellina cionopaga]
MTSKPVFSYPVPHSTFIPISYESITTSGQTRKRKRTKSLATNPSDIQEEEDEDEAEDSAQDENKDTSQNADGGLRGLASPDRMPTTASWTPTNPRAIHLPALTTDADDKDDHAFDDDSMSDGKSKALGRSLEHRIRNAGYADDIVQALPPLQPTSLQAKHMNHVNTILHICLLRRDWKRAKRAFRLLLLSDSETDVKNLRLKRIWKLGVEILSWESEQQAQDTDANTTPTNTNYTKAMEYMNRLVIMYPHYKHYVVGKGVNATTILPILMHFEILALHEKLSTALTSGETNVIVEVISGTEAVTERLQTLQETPPWVDMADLWKLRGQLNNWAADLSLRLLNDDAGYTKYRILSHAVARKMKERGISGWEEFMFEYGGTPIDDYLTDTSS